MPRHWVIVPAAGRGARMATERPKQYLSLAGRTLIEWSLLPFLRHARIDGIVVVLAAEDREFRALPVAAEANLRIAIGGNERADSVRAGLETLAERAVHDDWVLVHDAARPCLRREDLERLLDALDDDPIGGLLASPSADTLKRADRDERVAATIPRANVWRAFTPQMFRYGLLSEALKQAQEQGVTVTDEAAAIERLGHAPRLIAGHADNLKVTRPEDLAIAEAILMRRIKS